MYQVLYRKWRSQTFSQVVGQEHITETLRRQVAAGRVSHAYLFTGTRGTGKTSCARILARAVNCLNPQDGEPCNECAVCRGILDGSILDVTELDAASNNGVGDIRDLRDELVYTPATAKRRVYIIDEVHMLSGAAFNALLKTLEEPPAHVLFILATTEVQKVPATILSRCQRFSFKRLSTEDIAQHLLRISAQETFTLTSEAAYRIARLSDGAMRDALAILDQCAVAGGEVTLDTVTELLGLTGEVRTQSLFETIAAGDGAQALRLLDGLYAEGKAIPALLEEMIRLYRDLLVYRTAGSAALAGGDEETLSRLSGLMPPEQLLYGLELLQESMARLGRSASPRIEAEVTLLRLCDPALSDTPAALSARIARLEQRPAAVLPAVAPPPASPPQSAPPAEGQASPPREDPAAAPPWEDPAGVPVSPPSPAETAPAAPAQSGPDFWPEVLERLHGPVSPMLYTHLTLLEPRLEGDTLSLCSQEQLALTLLKGRVEDQVAQAVQAVTGKTVRVRLSAQKEAPRQKRDKLDDLIATGGDLIHFTD